MWDRLIIWKFCIICVHAPVSVHLHFNGGQTEKKPPKNSGHRRRRGAGEKSVGQKWLLVALTESAGRNGRMHRDKGRQWDEEEERDKQTWGQTQRKYSIWANTWRVSNSLDRVPVIWFACARMCVTGKQRQCVIKQDRLCVGRCSIRPAKIRSQIRALHSQTRCLALGANSDCQAACLCLQPTYTFTFSFLLFLSFHGFLSVFAPSIMDDKDLRSRAFYYYYFFSFIWSMSLAQIKTEQRNVAVNISWLLHSYFFL